jgi:hypothetical protein
MTPLEHLLAWPALYASVGAVAVLIAIEVLHVAGVRWRAGWLEVLGGLVAVATIAVSVSRFFVYTRT